MGKTQYGEIFTNFPIIRVFLPQLTFCACKFIVHPRVVGKWNPGVNPSNLKIDHPKRAKWRKTHNIMLKNCEQLLKIQCKQHFFKARNMVRKKRLFLQTNFVRVQCELRIYVLLKHMLLKICSSFTP